MANIFGFFGSILGYVLWAAFYFLKDFGLSIVVFTIVIRLILFPFTVKQQKSMAGTMRLQRKQKELQEKYANNKVKLQEEMNKLYEKEGVKPMGGCLTMIIPLLVMLGIFYAVAYPLTNTLHLNSDTVNSAVSYMNTIPGYTWPLRFSPSASVSLPQLPWWAAVAAAALPEVAVAAARKSQPWI